MARKGRGGAALFIAAMGSFVAGTIGLILLTFMAKFLARVALKFGPPEYFAVMTLGFVVCLFMVGGPMSKALVMIGLGLLVLQYIAELLALVTGRSPPFGIAETAAAEDIAREQAREALGGAA